MKKSILVLILFMCYNYVFCQKTISEGILIYDITLSDLNPEETINNNSYPKGKFTITIKGNQVKKDFILEAEYKNVSISNYLTNKHVVLLNLYGNRYAIESKLKDLEKKHQKFHRKTLNISHHHKTINQFNGLEASLVYKNGEVFHFIIDTSRNIALENIYQKMPDLTEGIPLKYTITSKSNIVMEFNLAEILIEPVPSSTFRIEEGYKMISEKEYKKLLK